MQSTHTWGTFGHVEHESCWMKPQRVQAEEEEGLTED